MRALRWASVLVVLCLITACSARAEDTPASHPPTTEVAAALAGALTTGNLTELPATDADLADADYRDIRRGMDETLPEVTAGHARFEDQMAFLDLTFRWQLPGGEWTYQSEAPLILRNGDWIVQWDSSIVHPDLDAEHRLVHTRTTAERGAILGRDGETLMAQVPVLRLGLDKAQLNEKEAARSAAQLAELLDIDKDSYVKRVADSGPEAFVEAMIVRGARTEVDPRFGDIAGAIIVDAERIMPFYDGMATSILGSAGEATAEILEASDGAIQRGDLVGLTGLQYRYDEQLRGRPGSRVRAVSRPPVVSPRVSASPSGSLPAEDSGGNSDEPVVLFEAEPKAGKDLRLSLDPELQQKAEKIIGSKKSPTAMAVIDPSDGGVLVLAVSDSADGQTLANTGRYAPGSTFKIVTSLALLRAGLTPESMVDCSNSAVINGRKITNYSGFPSSRIGRMRLLEAVALSCNTAFVNEHERLSGPKLRQAAISLGMGQDHQAGFPSFFGNVPDPDNAVGLAEASFGQGTVEGSPMSMAAVAASVAAGRTTVPYLIDSNRPKQDGKPLTKSEAADLQSLMKEVVRSGSGRVLQGVATGAKTGTAEYGTADPPKTHAWMIAYTAKYAIAVMVTDGDSGSGTAGPLIKKFLS